MDPRAPQNRSASLNELLEFEKYKLFELHRQQEAERRMPNGRPELLASDIRACEEMIGVWTARIAGN